MSVYTMRMQAYKHLGQTLCDPKESSPCGMCQCAPRQEVLCTVNSNLLNNATHKVLKSVDHKHIYYLTTHTCFSSLAITRYTILMLQKGPQGF